MGEDTPRALVLAVAMFDWGVTPEEYMQKADPWPLNPEGELLLGIKIENKYALENAEKTAAVPGIGFGGTTAT